MTVPLEHPCAPRTRYRPRHRAWFVAAITMGALVAAAGFRSSTGALLEPLEDDFGWSRATTSGAVSLNLVLYGLTAPFAAALMERFGVRRVVAAALVLVALGSGLTLVMTEAWQLWLLRGVRGRRRHRVARPGLRRDHREPLVRPAPRPGDRGLLGCGRDRPAGLPARDRAPRGRPRLAVGVRDRSTVVRAGRWCRSSALDAGPPADVGTTPYGAHRIRTPVPPAPRRRGAARGDRPALRDSARSRTFWILFGSFWICGWSTNGLIGTHFIPAAHDHGMPIDRAPACWP